MIIVRKFFWVLLIAGFVFIFYAKTVFASCDPPECGSGIGDCSNWGAGYICSAKCCVSNGGGGGGGGGCSSCNGCETPTNPNACWMYFVTSATAVRTSSTTATVSWVPNTNQAVCATDGGGVRIIGMTNPNALYQDMPITCSGTGAG